MAICWVSESTCREFKDDYNSHDGPHCIVSNLLIERIQEVQKGNQYQGKPNLDTVNHILSVLLNLLVPEKRTMKDFVFSKATENGRKCKWKLEWFFSLPSSDIFFSIRNGYHMGWFHPFFTSLCSVFHCPLGFSD